MEKWNRQYTADIPKKDPELFMAQPSRRQAGI